MNCLFHFMKKKVSAHFFVRAMESIPLPLEYYRYDTGVIIDCLNEIKGQG